MPFRAGWSGGRRTGFNPDQLSGLVGYWRNQNALYGAMAPVDVSGLGRNAVVPGAAANQPRGCPKKRGFKSKPVFRLDETVQSYAQAPGVVGDYPTWQTDDWAQYLEFQNHNDGTELQLFNGFGCWTQALGSNQNAVITGVNGSTLAGFIFVTSVAAGGTVHFAFSTATAPVTPLGADRNIQAGDRCRVLLSRNGANLYVRWARLARFPGDDEVVFEQTVAQAGGAPDPGASAGLFTMGADPTLATGFGSFDVSDMLLLDRPFTVGERAQILAWAHATYDFEWVPFVSSRPLINGVHIGVTAPPLADDKHPNSAGAQFIGLCHADNIRAAAAELGKTGPWNLSWEGDSRSVDFNADDTASGQRNVCFADLQSEVFTPVIYGPLPAAGPYGGAGCYGASGMMDRALAALPANPGVSQLTPNARDIAAMMALFPDIELFAIGPLGINQYTAGLSVILALDWMYERGLWVDYVRANTTGELVISYVNEPMTPISPTGPITYELMAFNRELHQQIHEDRAAGTVAYQSNIHD